MRKLSIILLLLVSITAHSQISQRSTTEGFMLSANFHVLGWTSQYFEYLDENAGSGIGGGVRASYGITQMFEPYIGYDITKMNISDVDARSFSMSHFDVGLRVNFAGTVHPVRPFVEGGYTYLKGKVRDVINGFEYVDVEFYGGKPHVGGGLSYFPALPVALFARGIFTVGKKSNASVEGTEIDDRPDVTTFRISIGATLNLSEIGQN